MQQNAIHQYKEAYEVIKKVDANALRSFVYSSTKDVTDSIEYWRRRLTTLIHENEQSQKEIIEMEIMRLEAILLARTSVTIDFFNISNMDSIIKDSEVIAKGNKHADPNFPNVTGKPATDELPFEEKTEPSKEEETPVIQLKPDKLRLSDIHKKCRSLLEEGKGEEALDFAKTYLAVGNYIPKKEKQQPESWTEARINSWLEDIKKIIQPVNKQTTTEEVGDVETTEENTTEEVVKNVILRIEKSSKNALIKLLKENNVDPKSALPKEVFNDKTFEEMDAIYMSTQTVDVVLPSLKEAGIDVSIYSEEEEQVLDFINKSNTLDEEITHINTLIKLGNEIRKHDPNSSKPDEFTKEDEKSLSDLINLFFKSRSKEDYPEYKKVYNTFIKRPEILKNERDFFTIAGIKHLDVYTGKDKKNTDTYDSVCKYIVDNCKKDEFEETLLPALVKSLRGKIIAGKTDKGTQMNRAYLNTSYHVLHFVDSIIKEHETKGEESAAVSNQDTQNASTASDGDSAASNTANAPKVALVATLNEELFTLVKNGGILEDALKLPVAEQLKGETVSNPETSGELKLDNDEVYNKYISFKYNEALDRFRSTLTHYPAEEMMKLIQIAVKSGVTEEEFVKQNIELLKVGNKYLPIKGTLDNNSSITITIVSEKDFAEYVKSSYDLCKKVEEEQLPNEEQKVYQESTFKDFKTFEDAVKNKVTVDKMSLEDLQAWAKEVMLDKIFKGSDVKKPMFREEHAEALSAYIEVITRPLYTTPEIEEKNLNTIKNFLTNSIKNAEEKSGIFSHVGAAREFASNNKMDFSLKKIRELAIDIAKEHNKTMYDKYIRTRNALDKDKSLATSKLPDGAKTEPIVDQPVVLVPANKTEEDNIKDKVKFIIEKSKDVKSEKDFINVINTLELTNSDKVALLKASKFIFNNNLKSLNKKEEQINQFVKEQLESPFVETENKEEPTKDTTSDDEDGKDYDAESFKKFGEDLSSAKDKADFQKALNTIITNFKDSSEVRGAIIQAIKDGKGNHTIKVAKQNQTENHKMIKKAYERYRDLVNATS